MDDRTTAEAAPGVTPDLVPPAQPAQPAQPAPDTHPPAPDAYPPAPDWWTAGPPPSQPVPAPAAEPERGRSPIVLALIVIAVLAGAALFASGFTLGLQQALAPGTPANERDLFDPFWEAYRKITTEYVGKVQPKALVEGAIKGMFGAVDDPYSSYMTSEEYQQSLGGISGEFEGIGAQMTSETSTGEACDTLGPSCALVVVSVIRDSPAEHAGLLANDHLVAVDGTPVDGKTLDEVVALVKGPKGTDVTLSLLRPAAAGSPMPGASAGPVASPGGSPGAGGAAGSAMTPVELTIRRDVVRSEDVHPQVLGDGTVGYLDIAGFSGSAAGDFHADLQKQLDAGIRSFVIDVRDDPGGYVDAALAIASEFIKSGPVYWEEYADGRQQPTNANGDGLATDPGIKVAVLINGGSASASEILAGALQDTGRGTLIGERSFGKGTIQQWHLLSNDTGGFRLSVAKWLTPDKRWIHGEGLTPDIQVGAASAGTNDDPQLARALAWLAAPVASPAPGASVAAGRTPAPGSSAFPTRPLVVPSARPSVAPSVVAPTPAASVAPSPAGSPAALTWPVTVSLTGVWRHLG
ncbi:MAG: S41 family peptidase [Chloroflexota bacterium]